jgi:hypothetical protein
VRAKRRDESDVSSLEEFTRIPIEQQQFSLRRTRLSWGDCSSTRPHSPSARSDFYQSDGLGNRAPHAKLSAPHATWRARGVGPRARSAAWAPR